MPYSVRNGGAQGGLDDADTTGTLSADHYRRDLRCCRPGFGGWCAWRPDRRHCHRLHRRAVRGMGRAPVPPRRAVCPPCWRLFVSYPVVDHRWRALRGAPSPPFPPEKDLELISTSANGDAPLQVRVIGLIVIVQAARADGDEVPRLAALSRREEADLVDLGAIGVLGMRVGGDLVRPRMMIDDDPAGSRRDRELFRRQHAR